VSKHLAPALSPLDGRYAKTTIPLNTFFSEEAYLAKRVEIEILYLIFLSKHGCAPPMSETQIAQLKALVPLNQLAITKIKTIEQKTHHDVKAIEYFLQEKLTKLKLASHIPFLHFGLTSEDVNNLAHRSLVKQAQTEILLPQLKQVLTQINHLSQTTSKLPILARTHGQAAIPTTFGKELSVFGIRILEQLQTIEEIPLTGKLNGAVGSFQALQLAFPDKDWLKLSQEFVQTLGLKYKLHTTQINQPDDLTDLFAHYHHLNTILIDLNQDIWRYISDNWLIQKGKNQDVGSSTMPQKINPIEFENSEGNLCIANSLFEGFIRKLPISRLQRDLSDSTVLRNLGVAFGHSLVAYHSLSRGLNTLAVNQSQINIDLGANWNILAEAMNTLGRLQHDSTAYENAADAFKGKTITQTEWQNLTETLDKRLATLTPDSYIGLAEKITLKAVNTINNYLSGKKYE